MSTMRKAGSPIFSTLILEASLSKFSAPCNPSIAPEFDFNSCPLPVIQTDDYINFEAALIAIVADSSPRRRT